MAHKIAIILSLQRWCWNLSYAQCDSPCIFLIRDKCLDNWTEVKECGKGHTNFKASHKGMKPTCSYCMGERRGVPVSKFHEHSLLLTFNPLYNYCKSNCQLQLILPCSFLLLLYALNFSCSIVSHKSCHSWVFLCWCTNKGPTVEGLLLYFLFDAPVKCIFSILRIKWDLPISSQRWAT